MLTTVAIQRQTNENEVPLAYSTFVILGRSTKEYHPYIITQHGTILWNCSEDDCGWEKQNKKAVDII